MDAGTRRLFVAAIVAIIIVTAGAALILGGTPQAPSPAMSTPPGSPGGSAGIPGSPVQGVIVAIDSRGLDDVRSFTLRTDDGSIHVFDLREVQDSPTFPLGHLAEHQATAEPVVVAFRVQDGVLLATRIGDA